MMKKKLTILTGALLLAATTTLTSWAALEFVPPAEPIPEPYTNETCLKNCHGEPTFAGVDEQGREREMFVDTLGYVMSTHGQKGIWCIDCQQGADPNTHLSHGGAARGDFPRQRPHHPQGARHRAAQARSAQGRRVGQDPSRHRVGRG